VIAKHLATVAATVLSIPRAHTFAGVVLGVMLLTGGPACFAEETAETDENVWDQAQHCVSFDGSVDAGGARMASLTKCIAVRVVLIGTMLCAIAATAGSAGEGQPKPFVNSLGMEMMPIPAGKFEMGADWVGPWVEYHRRIHESIFRRTDPDAWNGVEVDESPRHHVSITQPFYMASTEVTNAQYEAFDPEHRRLRSERNPKDDGPVANVSWYDAEAFCRWLSQREGKPYRLPTEAEWEYACRAGADDPVPASGPIPAGSTHPHPWGLRNMRGGVEEWCLDWHGPYSDETQTDPVGRATGQVKVLRGGSYAEGWHCRRPTNRAGNIPGYRHPFYGFRIVQAAFPESEPLPADIPQWARDVKQTSYDWSRGPDTEKPYFAEILEFAHPPEHPERLPFYAVNHGPAITWCENGDLLTTWWSSVWDGGSFSAVLASRLRAGQKRYDPPSLFLAVPDRCLHGMSMLHDGQGRIIRLQNISPTYAWDKAPLTASFSTDNGATWTEPKLVLPEDRYGQAAHMVMFRGTDGALYQTADRTRTDDGIKVLMAVGDDGIPLMGDVGSTCLYRSTDEGRTWEELTRIDWQLENLGKEGKTAGVIAGIHGPAVMLRDGSLLGIGRSANIDGNLILSVSRDGGRSWTYTRSEFPVIHGGQRPSMLRLREGPIMFACYTGPAVLPGHCKVAEFDKPLELGRNWGSGMQFVDAEGQSYTGHGLYAAVSYDEGKTWPVRKLITPGGQPKRMFGGGHHHHFTLDATHAEPAGYSYATQTPDGVIHLITSNLHYRFNVKWLETPPVLEKS